MSSLFSGTLNKGPAVTPRVVLWFTPSPHPEGVVIHELVPRGSFMGHCLSCMPLTQPLFFILLWAAFIWPFSNTNTYLVIVENLSHFVGNYLCSFLRELVFCFLAEFFGFVFFFFLLCFNLVPDLHYSKVYNSRPVGRRLLNYALSLWFSPLLVCFLKFGKGLYNLPWIQVERERNL